MAFFENTAVQQIMGVPLVRFSPQYVFADAIQLKVKHDFNAQPGQFVELDQFKRWGNRGFTKAARRRAKNTLIGTANSEGLSKSIVRLTVEEYTGPQTPDGTQASALWLTKSDLRYARTKLWQEGMLGFHDAVGSANLADDYQGWFDAILAQELMRTTVKFNPAGVVDGSVTTNSKITSADLDRIRYQLSSRNTPRFQDGFYHAVVDETMMVHLMQDSDFKTFAIAMLQGGAVPINQTPMVAAQQAGNAAVRGVLGQFITTPAVPIQYKGFLIWSSNNVPTRTVNSITASLGLFFGPDSVGLGSGGRGIEIALHNDTDYNRHFRFIWSTFMDVQYLLDDDNNTGCAVEARTYGTV